MNRNHFRVFFVFWISNTKLLKNKFLANVASYLKKFKPFDNSSKNVRSLKYTKLFLMRTSKFNRNEIICVFSQILKDLLRKTGVFSIKYFFRKCDQIREKLQIWSHLLKKSLMENFIFCAVCAKSCKPWLIHSKKCRYTYNP